MNNISATSAAQNAQAMAFLKRSQGEAKSADANQLNSNRVSQDIATFSQQALNLLQQPVGTGDGDGDGDGK